MGGFFGAVCKQDCVLDIFFGVDYHSHLGTRPGRHDHLRQGGRLSAPDPQYRKYPVPDQIREGSAGFPGLQRHRLHQRHRPAAAARAVPPWPVRASPRLVSSTTRRSWFPDYFSDHGHQFMAMSSGKVNSTELVAALINQKDDLVSGILHAQELIDGSLTLLVADAARRDHRRARQAGSPARADWQKRGRALRFVRVVRVPQARL